MRMATGCGYGDRRLGAISPSSLGLARRKCSPHSMSVVQLPTRRQMTEAIKTAEKVDFCRRSARNLTRRMLLRTSTGTCPPAISQAGQLYAMVSTTSAGTVPDGGVGDTSGAARIAATAGRARTLRRWFRMGIAQVLAIHGT